MKKRICIWFFVTCIGLYFFSFKRVKQEPTKTIVQLYQEHCVEFENGMIKLNELASDTTSNPETWKRDIQLQLDECRLRYKKVEMITEYFFPATAEGINGPLVDESDDEEGTQKIIVPDGLQVIQDMIYNDDPVQRWDELRREIQRTTNYAKRQKQLSQTFSISNWQVFDAAKLELIRIFIMGFAGYDSPESHQTISENIIALKSIQEIIELYRGKNKITDPLIAKTCKTIQQSIKYLQKEKEYETLDRFYLITQYMNPLFEDIENIRRSLNIPVPELYQPLRIDATSFWETNSYDLSIYSRYDKGNPPDQKRIELGKLLFFDPILSDNVQRSCASCHRPDLAFTDGFSKSIGFDGNHSVMRNAPSLLNVGFQGAYFYDSRASTLEDQVRLVVSSQDEIHGDLKNASTILNKSEDYRRWFVAAFKGSQDTLINPQSIIRALASYERSLFSFSTRFDQAIKGKKNVLSSSEINGFNLFMGKALCGTCHFPPMFNGNLPPFFTKTESEIIGVPERSDKIAAMIDPDKGRGAVSGLILNHFSFKTPTVRNVELTSPYMHNGIFTDLDQVIDFYNDGGGVGWGFDLPNQTLPFDSLALSKTEKQDLVAFLKTLTDTVNYNSLPQKLPCFENDPIYNSRIIGGKY